MAIQLTQELLQTFLTNAKTKLQQSLAAGKLTPFVFANTALLWLVPSQLNHPLRKVLGLTRPFILISSANHKAQRELNLHKVVNVTSGAFPLASWDPLVLSEPNELHAVAQYEFEWGVQALQPLDRNKARILTAQYAQILPQLTGSLSNLALPMLVFTWEAEHAPAHLPFYLAVSCPSSSARFADVVAVKCALSPSESVSLLGQPMDGTRMQHWAEYELLGSLAQAEHIIVDSDANLEESMHKDNESLKDCLTEARELEDAENIAMDTVENDDSSSIVSGMPTGSLSYAVLHGVWSNDAQKSSCIVDLPPVPSLSAQWMLELLSVPLALEPEANPSLESLRMEIKRLETWCDLWMDGARWEGSQQSTVPLWQAKSNRVENAGNTTTIDSIMAENANSPSQMLPKHREAFGKQIDKLISGENGISVTEQQPEHTQDICALDGFPKREDQDFADRLWNLAHHAWDDEDLSEAIAAVAEGLETRKLQPYIHNSNKSMLAQIIRQALQISQTAVKDAYAENERLAGQMDMWIDELPLDPFVHLGLYKLRADFWFYFVSSHLATPRQLHGFLDMQLEPKQLVGRFWLLLRVLEVWWLLRQSVPGMPSQFTCQIIGVLLDKFAGSLKSVDDGSSAASLYNQWLKVTLFLPVYSSDVQGFVDIIADGFDPARYTVAAIGSDSADTRYSLAMLTKTPLAVDPIFADSSSDPDISMTGNVDEKYVVFNACRY
ncbi:hypothetical protein IWW36_003292 [Coemansia brasiliensis]|uniref:Uncharacterized protein n=1 Tax=Coemansia brasiliensis TaxID=2650707 RepID=A0A9W8M076_9FUNG|nr:hypothetical protein IWW36_003292 [Coemansia brasiliensis]